MQQGRLITIDGLDGCGKTSQSLVIKDYIERHGIEVMMVREPGGTSVGEQCREMLRNHREYNMVPNTEALLFAASRAQLFAEVIQPALEKNIWIISDRGLDALVGYQSFGRGVDLHSTEQLEKLATGERLPDLTFFLDISAKTAMKRCRMRNKDIEKDRFESETQAFFEKVREGYTARFHKDPCRIVRIDGEQSYDDVSRTIKACLDHLIAWKRERPYNRLYPA